MNESCKEFTLNAVHGGVTIKRDNAGVPHIKSSNSEDGHYGIGWVHGVDRLAQMALVREIAYGSASESFEGSEELIELDKYMRWLSLWKGLDQEVEKLSSQAGKDLESYCKGVNAAIEKKRRPLEFLVTGYRPRPWTVKDCLVTAKVVGFIGLAQAQGEMEKFLLQLIRNDISEDRIKALFPYLSERIDYDLMKEVKVRQGFSPSNLWKVNSVCLRSSNNWVVAGAKTKSGHPILAGDPHMEVNRLPSLWYEIVWRIEDRYMMGITLPGLPIVVMGRHNDLAWNGTYGFMDMIDFFIEEIKDGQFLYDGEWRDLEIREEVIRPKNKAPIKLKFYENHHGILEGVPDEDGKYLAMRFTGRDGGADVLESIMAVREIKTVQEAQKILRNVSSPTFNFLLADRSGSIGYQMCGAMPNRPEGISGLIPIPGWEKAKDWNGIMDPDKLPSALNPEEGSFATANDDLNRFGKESPINLPMGSYRAERIRELLAANDRVDPEYIKKMHFDLYSKQAELLMPIYLPLLPDNDKGDLLRNWDYRYTPDSNAATVFESIYSESIKVVFGKYGLGEDLIEYFFEKTGLFNGFYANFDNVLMDENSPWFKGIDRETQLREAVTKGLECEVAPYGSKRRFDFKNIFFGGKLPDILGFDIKNRNLPGNRATIPQGQIFWNSGHLTTFSPSVRMISEMEKNELQTNIAGGPSGRRFSRWYRTGVEDWEKGIYKKLKADI